MRALFALVTASLVSAPAAAEPHRIHAELDPLPFVRSGYGGQIGYRAPAAPRLRLAVASFSLDVPDVVAQLGGNDDFHLRVRPSVAIYGLYVLSDGRGGWVAGGALRYLRLEYSRDDLDDRARVGELSIEAIAGYKWHPLASGFYLQPWGGVSRVLMRRGDAVVGGRDYKELPVGLFATVNIGWELSF